MRVQLAIILTVSLPAVLIAGSQPGDVASIYFTEPRSAPVEMSGELLARRKLASTVGNAVTQYSRSAESFAGQFFGALIGDVLVHNGTAPEHDYVDADGFFWHGLNEEPPLPKGALLLKIHVTGGCEERMLPQEFWRVLVGTEKSLAMSAPERLVRQYVAKAKAQVEQLLQTKRLNCLAEFRPVIENVPEVYYPRSGVHRHADADDVPVAAKIQLPPFPVLDSTEAPKPAQATESIDDVNGGLSKPGKTKWWPFGKPKGKSGPVTK